MMRLIDIHSHILYGADDGARTEEDSHEMLKMAAGDGIRAILLTPHYHREKLLCGREECLLRYRDLKKYIEENKLPLRLAYGAEIYYVEGIEEELEQKKCPTLNATSFVLVEFDPGYAFSSLLNGLLKLQACGYQPILAHAERYECILEKPDRVRELKDHRIWIQLNAGSVLGDFGRPVKSFCKGVLKKGLADIIATDAHSVTHRKPLLSEAYKYTEKKYGEAYANALFFENPLRVLQGKRD